MKGDGNMQNIKYHYECLGCHKPFNTYKLYPYGWICLNCRPTVYLTVKCSVCGCDVPVQWDTYRMKDPSISWRCRSCNDKYRNALYEAKPEEEKKAFVESQRERSKAYWSSLDDKTKEADSKRRKDLWKKRKEDGSGQFILDAMKEGRANWWNSLSDEEKEEQWSYMEAGRAKWWNNLTNEEKAEHMKHPHEGFTKWFNRLSSSDRKSFLDTIQVGHREFWENMTTQAYIDLNATIKDDGKTYFESDSLLGNKDVKPTSIEVEFINLLKQNGIDYTFQYRSKQVHPDFVTLFPRNPITGMGFTSPYHYWDFMLDVNGRNILIDVDGGIHFKETFTRVHPFTNKEYSVLEYNKFSDSKRPYQTDGMDAYVVECPDNHVHEKCIVSNVKTGEKTTLKSFIATLWYELKSRK